jgi:hypothetical protein
MKMFASWPTRLGIIAGVGVLVLVAAYLGAKAISKPHPPRAAFISICKNPAPGMTRIGGESWFQFDVPTLDFKIHEGTTDAPPLIYGWDIKPKNGTSGMEISFMDSAGTHASLDPAHSFSNHVERRVLDDRGHELGKDDWGYSDSGQRWRQVKLYRGGVVARYDFVSVKEAELFDSVIGSLCKLPDTNTQK